MTILIEYTKKNIDWNLDTQIRDACSNGHSLGSGYMFSTQTRDLEFEFTSKDELDLAKARLDIISGLIIKANLEN